MEDTGPGIESASIISMYSITCTSQDDGAEGALAAEVPSRGISGGSFINKIAETDRALVARTTKVDKSDFSN